MSALKWLVDRAKEGSTWAGAAILAAAIGVNPEYVQPGISVIVAVAAFVAMLLKDKPSA